MAMMVLCCSVKGMSRGVTGKKSMVENVSSVRRS